MHKGSRVIAATLAFAFTAAGCAGEPDDELDDLESELAGSGRPTVSVAYAHGIQVDGNLDGAWSGRVSNTLGRVVVGSRTDASDLSATFGVLYDLTNFYVMIDVSDEARRNDSPERWKDDAIELYFDMSNNGGASYDGNDFHYLVRVSDRSIEGVPGSTAGIRSAVASRTGGYRVEMAIPWSTLGVSPRGSLPFGFEVMVDDDDNGGERDAQLAWASPDALAYRSPDRFGGAVLASSTPVAPGRPPSKSACQSIVAHGAISNGPDATPAIVRAISAAKSTTAKCVYVPPGRFSMTKFTVGDGVKMIGDGDASVLFGPNPANRQINLAGPGSGIYSLQILTYGTERTNTNVGIRFDTASNFVIDDVTIDGGNGAGMLTFGGSYGRITNNRVRNTKADSIHLSGGAHHIYVAGNRVRNSGDDMVAVVSYGTQPVVSHDILIENNDCADQAHGRGITVVGGNNVTIRNNRVVRSAAAGIYIASESSYQTHGVKNVRITGNTVDRAPNVFLNTGHDAILVYSGQATRTIQDVFLGSNRITNAPNGPIDVRKSNTVNISCRDNSYNGGAITPANCAGDPASATGAGVSATLLGGSTAAFPQ